MCTDICMCMDVCVCLYMNVCSCVFVCGCVYNLWRNEYMCLYTLLETRLKCDLTHLTYCTEMPLPVISGAVLSGAVCAILHA